MASPPVKNRSDISWGILLSEEHVKFLELILLKMADQESFPIFDIK